MADDTDEHLRATQEYIQRIRPLLHNFVGGLLKTERPTRDDASIAVAAFVQVFFEQAYTITKAGGLGPGDFLQSVTILCEEFAKQEGTWSVARVESATSRLDADGADFDLTKFWKRA